MPRPVTNLSVGFYIDGAFDGSTFVVPHTNGMSTAFHLAFGVPKRALMKALCQSRQDQAL
jgi:hypothetical protein